jgi:hypothetical protein
LPESLVIKNTLTRAFTWAQAKLPPPGYTQQIAKGNLLPPELP